MTLDYRIFIFAHQTQHATHLPKQTTKERGTKKPYSKKVLIG